MKAYPRSAEIFAKSRQVIAGGVVSLNRIAQPEIAFAKAQGAYLWDVDGNRYIDYHAAFAPYFLGHDDPHVREAVNCRLRDGSSLYGSGTTLLEAQLAELICALVPSVELLQILNTGGEATYHAIRLSRAVTGRDHIIVMQGGFNGFHNDVSCNVMTPLSQLGPRISPGEYPFHPISAGIPTAHQSLVHIVNFNDLESVEYVCNRYPIAALITEPMLQNIGIVKPLPGYLQGLRHLADKYGFVLIFDEIKTGFRYCAGAYSSLVGVTPDLSVFGKALGNGYPIAVLGGKKELMAWFAHPELSKRVALTGTYNAHPVPTAAAIATIERMQMFGGDVFRYVDKLGGFLELNLKTIFSDSGVNAVCSREGSVFCIYFMDHHPRDWHDLATNHNFKFDDKFRKELIEQGVYFFPLSPKQCSISAAHTQKDIESTLMSISNALISVRESEEELVD